MLVDARWASTAATRCRRCSCSMRCSALGVRARLPRLPRDRWPPASSARRRRSARRSASVYTLAALFSLDAFGGGFVVQSMLALWLYQRFDLSLATPGTIFFWTGVLTAFSYLVAVRIADRIGLVNTMVFTHLPANLCLIAIPFVPDLARRRRAAAGAQRAVADGRADAQLLRDGDRDAGRARRRRRASPSVPRSLASAVEPVARRLPCSASSHVRLAARDRRRA